MTQFAKIKLSEKYITKSSQLNFSETPYFCGVQKHQKSWTKQNNCECLGSFIWQYKSYGLNS